MAAHLTGERRVQLFHLGFDERVTGLPHDRLCPGILEGGWKHLGTLDVEDDRRAASEPPHGIAAKEDEQLVAIENLPGLVPRPDPVRIAIERDSQLGPAPAHFGLEVTEV